MGRWQPAGRRVRVADVGNLQRVVKVLQEGAACHTGDRSCFDARQLPAVTSRPKGDDPLEPPKGLHAEGER